MFLGLFKENVNYLFVFERAISFEDLLYSEGVLVLVLALFNARYLHFQY